MALDAYRADFNDYPRPPDGQRKYRVLAWALIGPYNATSGPADPLQSSGIMTDGADGPGVRTVKGGKVWGPYLAPEKFPVSSADFPDPQSWDLMDRYGRPIEYYPRWRKPAPGANLFGLNPAGLQPRSTTINSNGRVILSRPRLRTIRPRSTCARRWATTT